MKSTKPLRLALAFCLFFCMLFTGIFPAQYANASRAIQYPITGDFGTAHTYSISSSGVMTITGSGAISPNYAKGGFPEGVAMDGIVFFRNIVEKIVISEGTTGIGTGAFKNYVYLKEVVLPSTLKTIQNDVFEGCKRLTTINLNEGLTVIESMAFSGCAALTPLKLPSTLESIGGYAFANCESITSVKLPDSVTSLGELAFADCKNLASVSYGPALQTIGADAFSNTPWLNAQPDGIFAINNIAIFYKGNIPSDGHVTVPNGITKLSSGLFQRNTALKSITLPSSLKEIADETFSWCTNLSDITLPEGLRLIGNRAFDTCKALKQIRVPASVKAIGQDAFARSGLQEIRFSKGLESVGYAAFGACRDLKRVVLPEGAKLLTLGSSSNLFVSCENLEEADLPGSLTSIPSFTFGDCRYMKTLIINEGTQTIGKRMFSGGSLESLYLPASVKTIGFAAFSTVKHVYYAGTEEQWSKVKVDESNTGLLNAEFTFNAPYERDKTLGDVDQNGSITTADARLALRRAVDLEKYEPDSIEYRACDSDRNGKITTNDARMILRAAIGMEDTRTW